MSLKGKVRFINKDKSLFFATLQKRVDLYFTEKNISKHANGTMVVKTIILLSTYILPFILLLTLQPPLWISLLLWIIMGLGVAGVGMSVMHDANHGAYSANKKVNYLLGHAVNLLGASAFNWKLQHNIMHHTYTNVAHMDEDIDDKAILRFSPHSSVKGYHKLQWLYAFLFYGILTLYWVTFKDFIQFRKHIKNGVNDNKKSKNTPVLIRIICLKLVYFFVLLVMPTLFFGIPFLAVLIGFLLMHFVAGIILTITFQLAHTVEGTSHPLPDEKGIIENDWAIHQLNTTVNFARHNKLLSWYMGGLNYQVEHHLFPRISHVHYPGISHIVKETAEEFNIPYLENETLAQALRSHIAALQTLGRLPDINEAIG
jgi:linoleoyl-CoA desaturase